MLAAECDACTRVSTCAQNVPGQERETHFSKNQPALALDGNTVSLDLRQDRFSHSGAEQPYHKSREQNHRQCAAQSEDHARTTQPFLKVLPPRCTDLRRPDRGLSGFARYCLNERI